MRAKFDQKRGALLSRYSQDAGRLVSRRRSESALRAAAVESALASRAKSEFLANMSHELRTPLNAIIGFSDLIASGVAPREKTVEYATLVSRAGHHLLNIISDILDISKIESGTFELDRASHALKDLIDAAVSLVEPRIHEKKQTLQVRLGAELPTVSVDGRRIKQVLINLLTNAHKFTPKHGTITLIATADRPGFVTVAINDSGIGMSPEQLTYALQAFAQIKAAYTRSHEGTGLGLPISKSLIEQHGGRFFLSSQPNVGTMAAFTLPSLRSLL
jgi:two-component system cell cycle sensor histidine kinase PleC